MALSKKTFPKAAGAAAAVFDPLQNFETVTYTGNGSTQKITGYIRKGAAFNGSSSKIILPNSLGTAVGNNNFSVSFWVYVNDASNDEVYVNSSNPYQFYVRKFASGNIYIELGGVNGFDTGVSLGTGWHHIAVTKSSSAGLVLYVDNSANTFSSKTANLGSSSVDVSLGGYNNGTLPLDGKLDQVRFFNTALNSTQVGELALEEYGDAENSVTDFFGNGTGVALYELDENANESIDKNPAVFERLNTSALAYSENDTRIAGATAGNYKSTRTTESKTSGKYYVEMKYISSSAYTSSRGGIGIVEPTGTLATYLGTDAQSFAVFNGGNIVSNNASVYNESAGNYADNDIIMLALDMDNQKLYAGENGTWYNSANPASGTGGFSITGSEYYIGGWAYNTSDILQFYFKSSLQTYTAPTGFDSWSEDDFSYNGTPTNVNFLGMAFQPDLVWIKNRTGTANNHQLYDSVRDATVSNTRIYPNLTNAQAADANGVTALNSNGFTLGNSANVNDSSSTYVAWCWKAGGAAVSNSNGGVTSQVSANTAAGFSIATWTYSSGTATVGHGLNSAPELIIYKKTSGSQVWLVFTTAIDGSLDRNYLDSSGFVNSSLSLPTDSVFSIDTGHTGDYVGYCFHSVDGYQRIGTYTGASGLRVYTTDDGTSTGNGGFQPRFLMVKKTTSANWVIIDSVRVNGIYEDILFPNTADAEAAGNYDELTFNSDGFTWNQTESTKNAIGSQYIYLAIA